MKTFYFNIQSKGGSGKSMLTYLFALKNEFNSKSFFIDLDSSVRTSLQQLKFLHGKKPPRFATVDLLDNNAKIDRQLLFENLLEESQKDFDDFYLDFGAPESDQFPSLFSKDYTVEEFKLIEEHLAAKFVFNVVVAGGGAYGASTSYLQKITTLARGFFETNIYANSSTFHKYPLLIPELKTFASDPANNVHSVKEFGDFDITTAPHQSILRKIERGLGMSSFVFVEKIKMEKEISKL